MERKNAKCDADFKTGEKDAKTFWLSDISKQYFGLDIFLI
jgi:DUF438 domain-containing protein